MTCFFCKESIDSDHICQELIDQDTIEGPHTPEVVGEMRLRFRQFAANRRKVTQ